MKRAFSRVRLNAWMGALMLAVAVSPSLAETLPARGAVDSRIRTAMYDPNQVYRLYGFVGYGIELIFEPGESFVGPGGGDVDGITFGAHANHLILKPKALDVRTNVVIFTTRRAYRFDYTVSTGRPDRFRDEVMYAVRFIYPPPPPQRSEPTPAEQVELDLARAERDRPRNTDYWFCGKHALKPVAAFDDGVHTRIRFGDRAEIPAIFVRNEDGSESLLNFSMDAGDVVIHRVAPKFILRRGRLTGCIVNKNYLGTGLRLDTGTVSPRVERDVKEPQR